MMEQVASGTEAFARSNRPFCCNHAAGKDDASVPRMLWLFERNEQSLRLETQYDQKTSEYVVTVRSGEREDQERFTSAGEFRAWLAMFEQRIEAQRWATQTGGPVALPADWSNDWLTG
jgi:hypothetical protein